MVLCPVGAKVDTFLPLFEEFYNKRTGKTTMELFEGHRIKEQYSGTSDKDRDPL